MVTAASIRAAVLLSGHVALIGGNSTKPGSSYSALIKAVLHSATAGYPARSSRLLDFDGESAGICMESCLVTAISPSDTVEHIALAPYGVPNATMRRLRNRSQNGAEQGPCGLLLILISGRSQESQIGGRSRL